jgi:hypothetical protein
VMMECYLDESGIHGEAQVCVVAGFYGTQAAWRIFEKQWNKVIADYPELEDCGFHAKVFFKKPDGKRIGPYRNWSDDKARTFLERLVQTVMRNRIFPITYAVIVDDFLALSLRERKWFTGAKFLPTGKCVSSGCPNKSYYVPFNFFVLDATRMSGANAVDKIHFFAGLDRSFHRYASTLYNFILKDSRLPSSVKATLGQMSYPLAKDTPGIQAADLLAYRLYRYAQDKIIAKQNLPVPTLIFRLTRNRKVRQRFTLFDSSRLRDILNAAEKEHGRILQESSVGEYFAKQRRS